MEAFIHSTLDALAAAQPGAVVLALVSPIYVDNQEIVELSIVRWRQWGTTPINARDLAARFFRSQERGKYGVCQAPKWGLTTIVPTVDIQSALDHETNAAPMAAVYGFNRIGYLQKDLYPSRLYYPVMTGLDDDLTVEPTGSKLSISATHGLVATACYWNAGWSPGHPSQISGLCGTALVGTADSLHSREEFAPDRHFYLWRVTRLRRSSGYGIFTEDDPECGIIPQHAHTA